MRRIPTDFCAAFQKAMLTAMVPESERNEYLRWLRFYLDFCSKYSFPPRDPDSLAPFLNKLSEKNQSRSQQEQAGASVQLYHALVQKWVADKDSERLSDEQRRWEECYVNLKQEIRIRQYSPKTLKTYSGWIAQFQRYLKDKDPRALCSEDARRFLSHLAVDRRVAASTQNQAFNALLFLYRHVLKAEYELGDTVVRARRTKYIPVVLTREEVDIVIGHLDYPHKLAIQLMYGCGLRLFECVNLRVHCFNLDEGMLTVHDGKGKKDRSVPLPKALYPQMDLHFDRLKNLHCQDLAAEFDGVFMPGALDRKWKSASKEFTWQWFFPAKTLTYVPRKTEHRRYHMHESHLQKSLRAAVLKSQLKKRVTSHTFRHSFASHLLMANYDIRTIQQLLGHSDIRTTMIYLHTVKGRTIKEVASPLDFDPETA
ncbi:MAG: integron integrase [Verrucomicrobia bacterium]|nr:integron integrase [Verrucomicrobiota bacterium]